MNARHAAKKDMARTVEIAWEQKKTNTKVNGTYTQGPEHHQPVPSQYSRGGPMVKGFKEYGLVVGEKMGSILRFLLRIILGKMPCWDGILPRRGKQRA